MGAAASTPVSTTGWMLPCRRGTVGTHPPEAGLWRAPPATTRRADRTTPRADHRLDLCAVPRFEPFPGLRYDAGVVPLERVVAPPYDVLSEDERQELAERHERNIVHIDLPLESEGRGRYQQAAILLDEWRADGTLVTDDAPSFTLYRMAFTDDAGRARETVGVIGALEVVDPGAGDVLPHERTTPRATTDRLDLTRATQANLSPIWGLSLADGLTELLTDPGVPLGSVVDDDGVLHTVERVDDDERCRAVAEVVARQPVLIADGHHRYGVSQTYRDERRAEANAGPTRALGADDGLRRRAGRGPAQRRADPPTARRPTRRPLVARGAGAVVRPGAPWSAPPRCSPHRSSNEAP